MGDETITRLEELAKLVRYWSLTMTTRAGSGHPTSSLSAAELMVGLLFGGGFRYDLDDPGHPNNDRLIFSKGHASPLFYSLWAAAGALTEEDLKGYRTFGSPLEGHATVRFRYADAATGSLGQGLSIGLGMALNAKYLDELPYRTYVLLGDSEMAEGSQWEAIQIAAHYRLDNLVGILDVNRLGQRGETMYGHDVEAYRQRVSAFGWEALVVDGHCLPEVLGAYAKAATVRGRPTMIIARTIKGKGVPFLEDRDGWHGKVLGENDLSRAVAHLAPIDAMVRGSIPKPEDQRPPVFGPGKPGAVSYATDEPVATREAYGNALVRLYHAFPALVSLDAEVSNSTMAETFAEVHPKSFFEMYIAEQSMVGTALGLACRGKLPFVSTFAAFHSRAFDQIRMSQYSDANVKFVGSHAGVSIGPDGPSQMGLEDLALFRTIVDGVVLYPADAVATEKLVEEAARHRGIVYLRTARQKTPVLYAPEEAFPIGGSKVLRSSDADAVTIVAAGATLFEALKAYDVLKGRGVLARVIDLYSVKPADAATLVRAAEETRALLTVEDHYAEGGLGEAVRSALEGAAAPVYSLAVRKKPRSGKPDELLDYEEISAGAIVRKVLEIDNRLLRLKSFGQSLWLDYIRRRFITSGELRHLIDADGLDGVTSNPSLFDKAIEGSDDYDDAIRELIAAGRTAPEVYEALAVEDVRAAADVFRPLYDRTGGQAGYVSLEVNPHLARDAGATAAEARRLWRELDRPNVFVKVPATREGLAAIRELTAEGINVNVTLLFAIPRYAEVAEAYLAGLEERAAKKLPLTRVASVASFFLSRIDVLVDPLLEKIVTDGAPPAELAASLKGQVALASARVAYARYRELFGSDRFRPLAALGAAPQRVLWASTGTKNPEYSDVKYVEALIGPETIDTLPLETLHAYRDHGDPAPRLDGHLGEAERVLSDLASLGIDLDAATEQLEAEGVEKFVEPYDALMRSLEEKRGEIERGRTDRERFFLGAGDRAVRERGDALAQARFPERLWRQDTTLWTTAPGASAGIRNAMGWLHAAERMEEKVPDLRAFAGEARDAGFRHAVDLGMGGSSLAPLVFAETFGAGPQGIALSVLDTTDPAAIRRLESRLPLAETLFLVASKSGTTTEPLAFADYFYAKLEALKPGRAGESFVAITDPGTALAALARDRGFRRVFLNFPDVGGRYSALTHFGLVPAALLGVDLPALLRRAIGMVHACGSCVPADRNPGVALGAALGELARRGRDKATLVAPPGLASFGLWVGQLLAESTGKDGTGIIPVAGEPLGPAEVYGTDRVFVRLRLAREPDAATERALDDLRKAGHPVLEIDLEDRLDVGREFFRWEVATATTGAILGINPFDQPNVQEGKDGTNRLLEEVRREGKLPEEEPSLVDGALRLYGTAPGTGLSAALRSFLGQARPADYVALLAFLPEDAETDRALADLRVLLRDRLRVATVAGYGPRYIHSVGQLHKGGPNTGLFLLLTADAPEDVPIPGRPYSFGVLERAQAQGDLEALRRHGRRAVRIHLGDEPGRGLGELQQALRSALAG